MPVGLFVAVWHLVDEKRMSDEEIQTYWEQRKHFEKVLPIPPFYSDGNSIGATTWFKENNMVNKLVEDLDFYFKVLKKYGVELKMNKSVNPGKIIYEDDFQVGVIKE
jgi:thiamine biosynthesis protein ThiC